MRTFRVYSIVEIEWDDSASMRGWREPEEIKTMRGLSACRTVGYLIQKTTKVVQVVQSRHDLRVDPDTKDFWAEVMTIPRSVVRRITYLNPRPPRR